MIDMDIYTVSLFGHREINQPIMAAEKLEKVIRKLISSKEYVNFLIGRDGEFDIIACFSAEEMTPKCSGCVA